jgi:hypothetical protein
VEQENRVVAIAWDWGVAFRNDLRDAASIIVPLPLVGVPGSELDGRTDAEVAWTPDVEPIREEFRQRFVEAIADAANGLLPPGDRQALTVGSYAVGPSAETLPQYIVTLLQDAKPYLNDAALLYTLGQAARTILRTCRAALAKLPLRHLDGDASRVTFTEPMIVALCFAHVRDTYHPRATVSVDTHFRSRSPDYGSPDHPGGFEQYTVHVRVGRRTYVYVVDSKAYAIEHFVIEGLRLTPLPLPEWVEHGFHGPRESHPVRRVTVRDRNEGPTS